MLAEDPSERGDRLQKHTIQATPSRLAQKEVVLAEVVVNDEKINEDELISYCKTNLASYKKPKKIVFRDDLPRLSTGKINKAKIKARYWKNLERSI